jgi:tetratricopeptide (TPR) repeat protein
MKNHRRLLRYLLLLAAMSLPGFAQRSPGPAPAAIQGTVLDAAHKPVSDAAVLLHAVSGSAQATTKTDSQGGFVFAGLAPGSYQVTANKFGLYSPALVVPAQSSHDQKPIDLVLAPDSSPANAMEFSDKPNFTVAGVTDWTAVGGHGSDAILRSSEALTRETIALKPDNPGISGSTADENKLRAALANNPNSFGANYQLGELYLHRGRYKEAAPLLLKAYQIDPANSANEYDLAAAYREAGDLSQARIHIQKLAAKHDTADLHRLAGDIDEASADPLAAVKEYQRAVQLDPSEQNYFAWGSELLLHRAVWQAQEVFTKGVAAYPESARMLAALGTSLFAGARYDEAAERFCAASDLNPSDPEPYIFLGKIQMAAPTPLPCVEEKLARFVQQQPDNSLANYLDAMAILKQGEQTGNHDPSSQVVALLQKAVASDPRCADGYLQLGILSFSQHDYEKAIAYYKQAIQANPQLGEAHYRLGVAYDRVGDLDRAKSEFQLHDEIEKQQAAVIEEQRREVKQFLVVLQGEPKPSTAQ